MDADTCGGSPGYAYDGAVVEVSVEGGAWQEVAPAGGYPYRIHNGSDPGPFTEGTPCYSGTCGWEKETFDLSAASGTSQIRFRFGSDGSVGRVGWVLDDVDVIGGETPPATGVPVQGVALTPAPLAMELGLRAAQSVQSQDGDRVRSRARRAGRPGHLRRGWPARAHAQGAATRPRGATRRCGTAATRTARASPRACISTGW